MHGGGVEQLILGLMSHWQRTAGEKDIGKSRRQQKKRAGRKEAAIGVKRRNEENEK